MRIVSRVEVDSPFVTAFLAICLSVKLLPAGMVTTYFGLWPLPLSSGVSLPLTAFRLFSHILGHVSWQHFGGNAVNLLLVGPSCERDFGVVTLAKTVASVALASSVAHLLLAPANSILLGSSGVVFAFILLSTLSEAKTGKIPLTFILQLLVWCTDHLTCMA